MSAHTRIKRWGKNLLLAVLGIAAALILAEIVLRVGGKNLIPSASQADTQGESAFNVPINIPDPQLYWRLKPLAGYRGIEVNSKGLRGSEFERNKKPGTYRIIVMGDSCTLGVGVSQSETYAAVLGNILNESKQRAVQYETLNAGTAGYSSLQGLRYLKSDLLGYGPDMLIVFFGLNDYIYTATVSDKARPIISSPVLKVDYFLRRSLVYRLIRPSFALSGPRQTRYPPDRRVSLADFKNNLKEIYLAAKLKGASVAFLNMPLRPDIPLVVNAVPILRTDRNGSHLEWLRPAFINKADYFIKSEYYGPISVLEDTVRKYPQWAIAHYLLARRYEMNGNPAGAFREYQKARETDVDRKIIDDYNTAIAEVARELDAPLVDLVSAFASRDGSKLFLDERHPSRLGHRLIAETIYHTLKDKQIVE
jgi:lysophospholipase L1-like esterase